MARFKTILRFIVSRITASSENIEAMITKEAIKKEVDKLPDSLLAVVYKLLRNLTHAHEKENKQWTTRNFEGKFDEADIRTSAYE